MKLLNLLIILFILSLAGSSFAQNKDDKNKPAKPEKLKTAWSAGVAGGATLLLSDVKYRFKGYGINVNINKALSNSMALRLHGGFGNVYGLNDAPAILNMVSKNNALNGKVDPMVNYTKPTIVDVYNNFKTTYKSAYLEAVYYFPLTDFRRPEKQKARIYIFAGAGGIVYNTKVDQIVLQKSTHERRKFIWPPLIHRYDLRCSF